MNSSFRLWFEFEEVSGFGIHNDFCNIHVYLEDGKEYGINVWTYEYFRTSIKGDQLSGDILNALYMTPPDLLVRS